MSGKRIRTKIAWGLILMLVLQVTTLANENSGLSKIVRANLSLDKMVYEHIAYEEVQGLLSKGQQMLVQGNEREFYKWENEYNQLYCKLQAMIGLIRLNYELNTSEKAYFEEYLYAVELLGKMKSGYIALFEEADSSLSEEVEAYYMLSLERDKLIESYHSKLKTTTVYVNQVEKSLPELLNSGRLTKAEKLAYYDTWYSTYNQETGEIFLQLVEIDSKIAQLQGYDTYAAYSYDLYERAYTIEESRVFFEIVKKWAPDVLAKIEKLRRTAGNGLKNYELEIEEKLLDTLGREFIKSYPELGEAFNYLRKYQLYDILSRDTKETGGFTVYLEGFNEPYIVLNYSYDYQTVLSLIHEFGHYYTYYTMGIHKGGLDLDETYSQALELLALPHYGALFEDEKLGYEAGLYVLQSMVGAIIDGCLYDEFLQRVYAEPGLTVEQVNQLYVQLAKDYGKTVDKRSWCEISHNYETPFYYLSYSVSAVAALEIWEKSLKNTADGIKFYLELVEASSTYGFIEALEKVGLSHPLKEATVESIMKTVKAYLEGMNQSIALNSAA